MPKYKLGAKIGSGGFAEVVECTRLEDGKQFAAKRLLSRDIEQLRRFEREIRLQATLSHCNVLPILARSLKSSPPWIVFPRAKCNMRELLAGRHGEEFVWMVLEATKGLAHAHQNGVIHRDLKPENILAFEQLPKHARLCVSDFGLGRFIDRDSTAITLVNMGLGTIAYMAPEQFTDAINSDARADIYAIGKILYEVLVGDIPYPSIDLQKVPPKFRYIIQRATNPNKELRYQTVDMFLQELERVIARPESFTKPGELIEEIVSRWQRLKLRPKDGQALAKLILENLDDNHVLLKVLPNLPPGLISAICKSCKDEFLAIIQAYDEQISGGISFTYCDTAADFLEAVWTVCDADAVRAVIINRLARMGPDNNRWHVGSVLARIVSGLDGADPALLVLRDVLQENERVRRFNRGYLKDAGLPPFVREVMRDSITAD